MHGQRIGIRMGLVKDQSEYTVDTDASFACFYIITQRLT